MLQSGFIHFKAPCLTHRLS